MLPGLSHGIKEEIKREFWGGKGDILSQDCVSVCLCVQELHSNIFGNYILA